MDQKLSVNRKSKRFASFSGLDDVSLERIEAVSTLCEYEMGQPIITNFIPDEVFLLVKGEIRHLVDFNEENTSFTINLYSPPYPAGFPSLLAAKPIENLSAASYCQILKLPKSDWFHLLDTHQSIGDHFYQTLYEADIWPLILNQSNITKPSGKKELRSGLGQLLNLH